MGGRTETDGSQQTDHDERRMAVSGDERKEEESMKERGEGTMKGDHRDQKVTRPSR